MANVKISALPTWSGTSADSRWFVMNNQGQTETFKYSGYSTQFIPANGSESWVSINLPTSYAPDPYMYIFGKTNAASAGQYSGVFAGRNNKTTNQFGVVAGGYSNTAGYICSVIGGGNNTSDGSTCYIIGGENNTTSSAASGILGGYGNALAGGNQNGDTIAGGQNNRIESNGTIGTFVVGGQGNKIYNFYGNTDGFRWVNGGIIGGKDNIIDGTIATTLGSNAFPIIIGGFSNRIYGVYTDGNSTEYAAIINSRYCNITKASGSSIFNSSGSTIQESSYATMMGCFNSNINNASGGVSPLRNTLIGSTETTINGGNRNVGIGLSGRTFGGARTGWTATENLFVYGQIEQQELVIPASQTTIDLNIANTGLVELTATGGTYNIDIQPATSNIGLEMTLMIHYYSAATINFVSAGNTQWKWGNGAGAPVFSGNNNYNILVFRSWDGNDMYEQSRSMWMS